VHPVTAHPVPMFPAPFVVFGSLTLTFSGAVFRLNPELLSFRVSVPDPPRNEEKLG